MATFQKPESALLKAEAFIEVGKKFDALETLHAAIQHRKLKNQWTPTSELIMVRHLELCVELQKMRFAREGLYQYRTMCQAANIGSLENVVQKFRKAAEEKVNEAKRQKDIKMAELADFDEMEAPQTILLRSIQQGDTRQQSQDRDVHVHFRFLWDTYKLVLDVLKSGNRLEDVYHETAQHATEFCRANQRPQEFKRLCETLRKNYAELHKHGMGGKAPQNQVNPSNPETVTRTLETRIKQLQIATELDLWRESYNLANEIFELMSKVPRVKPRLRSQYYDFLGQIFWKADNHLFHAFACLKNLNFTKAGKQDLTKEELSLLASKAVLSTLCVPFQKASDIQLQSLELTTEGVSSPHEKAKKHAILFLSQTVPTRDSIASQLQEKGLLALALQPCRDLFDLIESDFTPLSLCQDAKPLLDDVSGLLDGKLDQYVIPLKQIIFFRLMKQLSEVYASMTIENFEKAASIVPFNIAEKWMANAARQHGINIQINYSERAIIFGCPRKADMKSMRQPLIEVGYKLQQAMVRVAPEEQHKKEKLEKQQLAQTIVKRIEEETKLIRQRKEEIERRKEDIERRKEIQARKEMEKQREQEEREAAAERARLQQEREQREREREQQKKREAEREKNKEMLDEMKKQAEQHNTNLKINIAGGSSKKITEIQAEDLEKIVVADIEKAREAQVLRERQEKIRQRKLESKRVDHLARALREQEMPYLDDWSCEIEDQDREFLEAAEERNAADQRAKHQENLKERDMMMVYKRAKDAWASELLEAREEEYYDKVKERDRRLEQKIVDLKIQRAKERMKEYEQSVAEEKAKKRREREDQERREEEERARKRREQEEEERKIREEEERKIREAKEEEDRLAKEEERRKRLEERKAQAEAADRAAAKQREREREIEERQKAREQERDTDRRDTDRRGPPRREERKEEEDSWRSARGGGGGDRDATRGDRDATRGDRDATRGDRDSARGADRDEKPGAWRSSRAGADTKDDRGDWRRRGEEDSGPPRRFGNRDDDDMGPRKSARDGGRDDGDGWRRSSAAKDRQDDDRPSRPAAGNSWRDRERDREQREKDGDEDRRPWGRREEPKRDEPRSRADEGSGWRRDGARDDPPPRRDDPPRRSDRDDPPRRPDPDRPSAWGRPRDVDDAPPRQSARATRKEEPEEEAPRRKPPPAEEEKAPEPAAAEEDDDGFAVVTKGKKGKKPTAGAADASERRAMPPWKRNAAGK